jgi:hypothetical protein
MFTAMQLVGITLVIVGATLLGGVPGLLVAAGVALTYVGLAGER